MPLQFKNIDQKNTTPMAKKIAVYASLLLVMVSPAVAIAASPTPTTQIANNPSSASSSSDSDPDSEELLSPEVIQKNKERLQRALQNQSDKIKGVLDELNSRRKGMVGEVQRVSEETFTIKTSKATHVIAVTPETSIQKAGRSIAVDDIAVGDWAIVISSEEDDDLVPDRVIVSAESLRPDPQIVTLGSVVSTNRTNTELVVQTRAEGNELTFTLNRNTQYEDMNGNPAAVTNISQDLQVLVVAQDSSSGPVASTIRILIPLAAENDE